MGAIARVTHRSGRKAWPARRRDPSGRQRVKNFNRKVDAERYLLAMEADKLRGRYTDPRLAKTPLADWMAEYQGTRVNLGVQTQARDEATIRNHILPAFGTWAIGSIQPIHVGQWVADLDARGYAPATVRKAYQLLVAALDAAVESGLIARSPCRGVKLPKLAPQEMRFLDPAEISQLAEAIDPRYSAMVLTAAYTGLCFSELRALRVDRFDALRRTIRVTASLVEARGQSSFVEPKSEASRRTVRVPAFLVDVLAAHLANHADGSGLVFSAPNGARSGGATSGAGSGFRPSRPPWGNPARSTICGTPTPRCSSPRASTRRSSRSASVMPRSRRPSTPTGTCSKASTRPPPTASR